MHFSVAAILAFASAVLAQTEGFNVITKPTRDEKVPAGSTYEIVWQPTDKYPGPVTVALVGGATQASLNNIATLSKNVDGSTGKYSWSVDKSLGDKAIYGIQIFWEEDTKIFQYSFPFQIAGGASGAPSGSASSSFTFTHSSNSTIAITTTSASSTLITSRPAGNLSTTAHTTFTATTSGPSRTTSTSPLSTNGAMPTVGSTLALFGGLAMAVFAL